MSVQPRPKPEQPEDLELLNTLFATPPGTRRGWETPIALRSADEQRQHALRSFKLRTWVDYALHHAERIFAAAALVVFCIWLVDGPLRDWFYQQQPVAGVMATALPSKQATVALPSIAGNATTPVPTAHQPAEAARTAPLPYITSAMADAPPPPDEYIAPQPAAPESPAAPPPPTRLIAPAIGLDTPVREVFVIDGVWEVADYAAGYMSGTALPGVGNTALAGHAGIRGAVFQNLGRLAPGDEILLDAGERRFRYIVREMKTVWPTQIEVLDPTPTPTLTMMTCTNWDTQRLVVVADLIETMPTPAG
jgi:sortase A